MCLKTPHAKAADCSTPAATQSMDLGFFPLQQDDFNSRNWQLPFYPPSTALP